MQHTDYPKMFSSLYQYMYTYSDDVVFWKACAIKYAHKKPLIYVGPGVGRLMIQLLDDFEIIAVDRSPIMLQALSQRLHSHPQKGTFKSFTILPVDICDVSSEYNADLIILPCNVLTEWNSYSHIQQMLKSCYEHLGHDGHLVVEVDNGEYFRTNNRPPSEGDVNFPDVFVGKRRTWVKHKITSSELGFKIELIPSNEKYERQEFYIEHYAFTLDVFKNTVGDLGFDLANLYGSTQPVAAFTDQSRYIVADLKKRD